MQTGTLSGNSCSAYGAPATIAGTTSQTVASGNCYLLTLTGTDNVGNADHNHDHRQGRHHRADRADCVRVLRADERLLPRRRHDRLLQGRQRRRLHRDGVRRHRRRLRHRLVQLRRRRRRRLGQRQQRLHLHRHLPHRHRRGHRHQRRRRHRRKRQLHRTVGLHRPGRRRLQRQRHRSNRRRLLQLPQQRHHAHHQQPHRLHRDPDRNRLRPRQLHAHDPVRDHDRQQLRRLRRTDHHPRHYQPDRCVRQLLPAHPHRHRQRRQRHHHHHHRQGRHHRPVGADHLWLQRADELVLPRRGHDRLLQGRQRRRLHLHRLGRDRRKFGIASYNYGAIAGSGWANAAGAFTFTAASPTGTSAVTATNGAGVTGASASFTAQSDSTAPAGGAFTANGTAATGGGSSSYLNSGTTLTINSRTDYTETRPDACACRRTCPLAIRPARCRRTAVALTAHRPPSRAQRRRPSRAATAIC